MSAYTFNLGMDRETVKRLSKNKRIVSSIRNIAYFLTANDYLSYEDKSRALVFWLYDNAESCSRNDNSAIVDFLIANNLNSACEVAEYLNGNLSNADARRLIEAAYDMNKIDYAACIIKYLPTVSISDEDKVQYISRYLNKFPLSELAYLWCCYPPSRNVIFNYVMFDSKEMDDFISNTENWNHGVLDSSGLQKIELNLDDIMEASDADPTYRLGVYV